MTDCNRIQTPGEDPFRIKGYVKALLAGLEGNETTRKVIATCKHYAAYDLEKWNGTERHYFDAIVSSQDLSEYYLPPFQQCARDSNVGSIMCSYNALNGTPACADPYLMKDILRDHWGWTEDNNYITSDCNAIQVSRVVIDIWLGPPAPSNENRRTSFRNTTIIVRLRRMRLRQRILQGQTRSAKSKATLHTQMLSGHITRRLSRRK